MSKTPVNYEIAYWEEYDPLNGKHDPIGHKLPIVYEENFDLTIKAGDVITPFMQKSYEYLVIKCSIHPIYHTVEIKMIPHSPIAQAIFRFQHCGERLV